MVDIKTAWLDFPGYEGFEVKVANLSRKELQALRKRCIKTRFDRKTHQAVEEIDDDKFVQEFTKGTVKGWKGFKLKYVQDFVLIDIQDNDPDTELEYSHDSAVSLIQNSSEFDAWINEVVFDLANFRRAAEKNDVPKTGNLAKK